MKTAQKQHSEEHNNGMETRSSANLMKPGPPEKQGGLGKYVATTDYFKAESTKRGYANALAHVSKFAQEQFKDNCAIKGAPRQWKAEELNNYGLERMFKELCRYFEEATWGDNKEYEVGTILQYIGQTKQFFFEKFKDELKEYHGMETTPWYNDLFSLFGSRLRTKKIVKGQAVAKRTIPIYASTVEGIECYFLFCWSILKCFLYYPFSLPYYSFISHRYGDEFDREGYTILSERCLFSHHAEAFCWSSRQNKHLLF